MDLEPRPLHLRTGNTLRRPPLRSQKTWCECGGDGLLRLSSAASSACSALGLSLDTSVPHSLGKHGLWQLCAALEEADAALSGYRVAPRFLKARTKVHKPGYKELQRCVQLSEPEAACSEEELRLQIVWPPTENQLRRRQTSARVRRHRKRRRKAQLQIDSWEPSESDNETASESEAPRRLWAPTLAAFVAPKAAPPVRTRRSNKRRATAPAFPPLRLPAPPSLLASPDLEAAPEPPPEYRLDLEDVVALRSVRISADTAQIAPDRLRRNFGARLWEAASAPRRFAIDVSARVRQASGEPGARQHESGLAFLSFEVVREDELQSELEVKANVLLRPGPSELQVPACGLWTDGKPRPKPPCPP